MVGQNHLTKWTHCSISVVYTHYHVADWELQLAAQHQERVSYHIITCPEKDQNSKLDTSTECFSLLHHHKLGAICNMLMFLHVHFYTLSHISLRKKFPTPTDLHSIYLNILVIRKGINHKQSKELVRCFWTSMVSGYPSRLEQKLLQYTCTGTGTWWIPQEEQARQGGLTPRNLPQSSLGIRAAPSHCVSSMEWFPREETLAENGQNQFGLWKDDVPQSRQCLMQFLHPTPTQHFHGIEKRRQSTCLSACLPACLLLTWCCMWREYLVLGHSEQSVTTTPTCQLYCNTCPVPTLRGNRNLYKNQAEVKINAPSEIPPSQREDTRDRMFISFN